MAEINIRKKKPVWPWILLVIILAIVAFLYFYGSMGDSEEIDNTNDDISLISHEVTNINQLT